MRPKQPVHAPAPRARAEGGSAAGVGVPPHADTANGQPTYGEHPQGSQSKGDRSHREYAHRDRADADHADREHAERDQTRRLLADGHHANRPLADADPTPRFVAAGDEFPPAQQSCIEPCIEPCIERVRIQNTQRNQHADNATRRDHNDRDHRPLETRRCAGQPARQPVVRDGGIRQPPARHLGRLFPRNGGPSRGRCEVVAPRSASPRVRAERRLVGVRIPSNATQMFAERQPTGGARPACDKTGGEHPARDDANGSETKAEDAYRNHPKREHAGWLHSDGHHTNRSRPEGNPTPSIVTPRQELPAPQRIVGRQRPREAENEDAERTPEHQRGEHEHRELAANRVSVAGQTRRQWRQGAMGWP